MRYPHKLAFFISLMLLACTDVPERGQGSVEPSDYIWPMCGHIYAEPPSGWQAGDDCPTNRQNALFDDQALSSTFGPRQKASESYRYDYHRGIDIPAPSNSPLFAIADGEVVKAGPDAAFADNIVILRHYDLDGEVAANCNISDCLHSVYVHLNDWDVSVGQTVRKGQYIGLSGASVSGFEHLHFEIRKAPGEHDRLSYWQRDAVHPLAYLPLALSDVSRFTVAIDSVNLSAPLVPEVTVFVSVPSGTALTLKRVEIALYERQTDGSLQSIDQPQAVRLGETPEGTPYDTYPLFFDMNDLVRQYSYKDSVAYPFAHFQTGGLYESPFADELVGLSYNANIHLDNASAADAGIGEFNGLLISPSPYNNAMSQYDFRVTFTGLTGIVQASDLCVQAWAVDVFETATGVVSWNCS